MEPISRHFLLPASVFAERKPHIVNTILGSCIAVCLYDQQQKIGGMNHYMLPFWNGNGLASPKYGNIAIEKLLEKMLSLGATKNNLVAKIFGGAHQMNGTSCIGDRNIELAHEQLDALRIRIVAEHVGGVTGRKIWFDTGTGQVLMKFLNKPGDK